MVVNAMIYAARTSIIGRRSSKYENEDCKRDPSLFQIMEEHTKPCIIARSMQKATESAAGFSLQVPWHLIYPTCFLVCR